ncbi:Bug family tripartite tricarboxylate transporter substrate binding protein [Ottowia thiooxydans]|uniref:Tripartite-type tricarboxylate transporter receptor subunit TctC n=1 Tax=Ottowia thiooxydans TaxID=219182 RepID=A0ABV2Q1S0_9BURK
MQSRRNILVKSGLTLAAGLLTSTHSAADLKGSAPIRLVVPFAAGGASDTISRTLGVKIADIIGAPVLVDNKPGGGGVIGATATLAAKPDGRTLFVASNGAMIINPALRGDLKYNPDKDFKLVASMVRAPIWIWVRADLPVKNVDELVRLAKQRSLSAGSAGNGNITHLAMANFADIAGLQLNHVPFSGDTPALTALGSGTLDVSFNALIAALPMYQSGRIRPIAILDGNRDSALPEVPTLTEAGYPGTSAAAWFGLAAPAGAPDQAVREINKAVNEALAMGDVRERLKGLGFTALPGSIAEFQQMYDREVATWRPLVKKLDLKAS